MTLVTGATGGLGKALAREAWNRGHQLLLLGRDPGKLETLVQEFQGPDRRCWALALDLSQGDFLGALKNFCKTRGLEVDYLVNCAGLGFSGAFETQAPDTWTSVIQVNVQALTSLTGWYLGQLSTGTSERGILNVASVGAFFPGPRTAVYYASKAFVLNFSVALRRELAGKGIRVTAFCPASLDTDFHRKAGNLQSPRMKFKDSWVPLDPAARRAWRALDKNRPWAVPGILNRLGAGFLRVVSPRISAALFDRFS